jgi:hypothetical protein
VKLPAVRGEARNWRSAIPRRGVDRALLAVSGAALVVVVPLLWIFLVYGRALAGANLWVSGVVLCVLTAGIGAAMIRILDGSGE